MPLKLREAQAIHPQQLADDAALRANWFCLGQTTGRGKLDAYHQALLPIDTVWIYPLDHHFRRVLCG